VNAAQVWDRIDRAFGELFKSIRLAQLDISTRKVYASAGLIKGSNDISLALNSPSRLSVWRVIFGLMAVIAQAS